MSKWLSEEFLIVEKEEKMIEAEEDNDYSKLASKYAYKFCFKKKKDLTSGFSS